MAKSKAKKHRQKWVREGNRNLEASRSSFTFSDMTTRKTKTKKEKLNQEKHKERVYSDLGDNRSYLFSYLSRRNYKL
ncbi:hypothetical protein [Peribacillus acanthi]|uniref:hypothetical protein n=1 Tax=Peribacillus acanthi TaxID=2171554 RepID=UPI000D3E2BED|nr:hypothetical protein [Peribacillus acanthi]